MPHSSALPKLIRWFVPTLFVAALPRPAVADPLPKRLVVATWNVEWFYDHYRGDNRSELSRKQSAPSRAAWDWKRSHVARVIASIRPDIMALQEVENRQVLFYLTQELNKKHGLKYRVAYIEGADVFTEQDVAILYRSGLVGYCRREQSREMWESRRYFSLSKHIIGHFVWGSGDRAIRLSLINVHLRSRAEAGPTRRRQAMLARRWVDDLAAKGDEVIVTGDFNTEQTVSEADPKRTIGIITGKGTKGSDDDLVDLHRFLPRSQRQTHLNPGKQFDRILVSSDMTALRSARRPRLRFESIRTRKDLVVQGKVDTDHWTNYYGLPERERDVSDHYPVVATFVVEK